MKLRRTLDECLIGKDLEGSVCYRGTRGACRKPRRIKSMDSRCPCWDLNRILLECAYVATSEGTCSLHVFIELDLIKLGRECEL
jgi:hypothetical protein